MRSLSATSAAEVTVTGLVRDPERKLTEAQAALVLGLQPQTLAVWRSTKRGGPAYLKLGSRAVRYRAGDLLEWLEQQTVRFAPDGKVASRRHPAPSPHIARASRSDSR